MRSAASKLWWGLVRVGFRLLYQEMAFTYDLVANVVSIGQWWDWQRTALRFLPAPDQGKLLELAHGTGRFHIDLLTRDYQVIALDISRQMGYITRRRLQKRNLPVRLVRGMGQALPFPDATFSAVVSTFPTPFIIEEATLAEINRVLKSEGRLVVVVNGVLTKGGLAELALENAYRVTGQRGGWGIDLDARFRDAGFTMTLQTVELEKSTVQLMIATKNTVL